MRPAWRQRRAGERGQSLVEYTFVFVGVLAPLTFGLIALAQVLWIWHSMVDWTRLGARYAATHCWQPEGANVTGWMKANAPPIPDRQAFTDGTAELVVNYYKKNPESNLFEEYSCDAECSAQCVPDSVTVRVRNYQYRGFVGYLGLPPIEMPEFNASMPVESAGCDPEAGTCQP